MNDKDFVIERFVVGEMYSNAYLVYMGRENRPFLIDAGGSERYILGALSKRQATLREILLTHGHFDHVLAAGVIKAETGAGLFIHPDDAGMLKSPEACLCPHFMREGFVACQPDHMAPAAPVRVIHTPGHTLGSVCYYFEEAGTLFTGDTLFESGVGRTDLPGGNQDQLVASLKTLFALPEDVEIYPGHGEPSTIGREKGRYAL